MFRIDTKDLDRFARDLDHFAKKSLPHASRNAINSGAFQLRREWIKEQDRRFIVRNSWTARSIRIEKARGTNVRQMEALVGSTEQYLADREFGETKSPHGKHGVPIPTLAARGGSEKRLIRKPNRMHNIRLTDRASNARSRRQRNAIAIRQAVASKQKYVFLELEETKGIFRIMGGKRKPKLRMVWDLSEPSVSVEPMPTLGPALDELEPMMAPIYLQELIQQAKRNRVLGF